MTAVGRTSWWPCDAAEHDRELIVELGEEFGPGGPYTMRVLKDLAQQQRHPDGTGFVRTGFRALRLKTHVAAVDEQRRIVEHAAEIGALDDLVIDGDGRRFTCRISGWTADQARGRAAIKKAAQRATDDPNPDGDTSPTEETTDDVVPPEGDVSGSVPSTREGHDQEEEASPLHAEDHLALILSGDTGRLCRLLADLIVERDPKAKVRPDTKRWLDAMRLLIADRAGDVNEVEQVLRWSQADSFWQSNILSPTNLRKHFDAMFARSRPTLVAIDGGNDVDDRIRKLHGQAGTPGSAA